MVKRTLAAGLVLAGIAAATAAGHEADPMGHTTVEQTVVPGGPRDPARPGFLNVVAGPGEPYVVRPMGETPADPGRSSRRLSLAYFGQLTDFQLADEESPSRVEFVDRGANSAWRPMEAFHPHAIDLSLRQMNLFADESPVLQGNRRRAPMDFALVTGDNSDNQHRNETIWVRQLLEGTTIDPNSGTRIDDYSECGPVVAQALLQKGTPPEPTYTGVQDYSDYFVAEDFYDPNLPMGQWEDFPKYQGLMDRAQKPFKPEGLKVPTYLTNGNHDGLVQGNEDANREFERIATGCIKALSTTSNAPLPPEPSPSFLFSPGAVMPVPPDNPGRAFVDRVELKKIYSEGTQADGHGFAFVDKAELEASGYAATYYAWDARPGMRFISIDTVSEGGVTAEGAPGGVPLHGSAEGNIDDPQWQWLEKELEAAAAADKLVVVFGHHPIRSLEATAVDELASPCTGRYDASLQYGGQVDEHGHDPNPGCDLDPRDSSPIHHGEDLAALLSGNPYVIAYVAGHTHENKVLGFRKADDKFFGFWEINTSATADWPQQHRLIEVFDNRDGTLSIFGTVLDHGSPLATPPDTDDAAVTDAFSTETLAGLGRAFSYNDPQADKREGETPGAEGLPEDRNVELVLADPRSTAPGGGARGPGGGPGGPGGGGPGGRPGGRGDSGSRIGPGCTQPGAFRRVSVRARRSRRVGLSFARSSRTPVGIDVFLQARGRRILRRPRLVARFRDRLAGFAWNGRGRGIANGVYTVRFQGRSATGAADVRSYTLLRRRGRWTAARGHRRRTGCDLVRSFGLSRPVFGGRGGRRLGISYRTNGAANVSIRVLRGRRVVRRFRRGTRPGGVTHRLALPARGVRGGSYRVRLTASAGGRRVTATLITRRL